MGAIYTGHAMQIWRKRRNCAGTGCGTGTMTEILAGYGYDMIGVDNSEDML